MDPFRKKRRDNLWNWDADAAWLTFFRYPDVLDLERGAADIPGADAAETTLLGALASAIWEPVLAAEVSP